MLALQRGDRGSRTVKTSTGFGARGSSSTVLTNRPQLFEAGTSVRSVHPVNRIASVSLRCRVCGAILSCTLQTCKQVWRESKEKPTRKGACHTTGSAKERAACTKSSSRLRRHLLRNRATSTKTPYWWASGRQRGSRKPRTSTTSGLSEGFCRHLLITPARLLPADGLWDELAGS